MTLDEAKKILNLEKSIARLLKEVAEIDISAAPRLTFQIARIGDVDRIILSKMIDEQKS